MAAALNTDADRRRGWAATLRGRFAQGEWAREADSGGTNRNELWILVRVLTRWSDVRKDKLVLVRIDNAAAAAYANYGAGGSPQLAASKKGIKARELSIPCLEWHYIFAVMGTARPMLYHVSSVEQITVARI